MRSMLDCLTLWRPRAAGRIVLLLAILAGPAPAQVQSPPGASEFRQQGKIQLVLDPQGFRTRVWDLDFSPDGKWLAASGEKEIRLYDVEAQQLVKTIRGDRSESGYGNIYAAAFTPSGRELVVGIEDFSDAGSLRVYDTSNLDEIKQLVAGMNVAVRRIAFSRDGRYLVAAGSNGNLYVYDWPARRVVKTIPPIKPDQPIFDGLAFPTAEPVLLAFTFQGPVLYSIPDGKQLSPTDRISQTIGNWMGNVASSQVEYPLGSGRIPPQIWDVALDRGLWLAGGFSKPKGSPEYWVGLFDAAGRSAKLVYNHHRWNISAICASPVGDLVASSDLFGEIHLWNRRNGQTVHRFKSLAQRFYEASFDEAGEKLAFGTTNYRGSEYRRNHFGPGEFLFDLSGRAIAEAKFLPQVNLAQERTQIGDYRVELQQVGGNIHLVSRQGTRENGRYRMAAGTDPMCYTLLERHGFDIPHPVVFGDDRGVLACWNADSEHLHRVFIGHGAMVTSIGASPDGKYLVSSATDGEICVFSLTGRKPTGHPDFKRENGVVIELKPGSSSQRGGVRVGDRLITLDGRSETELDALLMLGTYDYRPGQQVTTVMERNGQRYTYQMTLEEGPDFVEALLHLFITAEREWILWTQQGYYDCSPGADRFIGWQKNRGPDKSAEFHAVQQFRKQLYRPDVIDKVIELGDVSRAIAAANAASGRNTVEVDLRQPDEFERLHPPSVKFLSPTDGGEVNASTIEVRASVSSPNDLTVRDVTFLLDGVPAHVAHPNRGKGGEEVEVTASIELSPGRHTLGIVASNGQTTSPVVSQRIVYRGGDRGSEPPAPAKSRPRLFALAIGINEYAHSGSDFRNLSYAANDASEFVKVLQQHKGGRLYDDVQTRLLLNAEATRVNILDGFDWLVRSARQGDIVMVFVSAHGFCDEQQNFYLSTHEVELDKLRATGVSWRELTSALHEDFPPCKRVLFLDTCHAGGVTAGTRVFDPVQDVVAPEVGVIVFTSSQPRQQSLEHPEWKHGAFTYALFETLKDPQGDRSPLPAGDQSYDPNELKSGIEDRVKLLTRDQQRPFIYVPPSMPAAPVLQILQ